MKKIIVGKNYNQSVITNRSATLVEYLKQISVIPEFKDAQEEYECAVRAYNGDEKAKKELVERNLRFVVSVAKQYANPNIQLQDLINEGNTGLIEAQPKFDPSKGFKFISFAVWYIRRNICEYIKSKNKLIRLPSSRLNSMNEIKKEVIKLEQELGREIMPNDIDIDNLNPALKIDKHKIEFAMANENGYVNSLDMVLTNDSNSGTYHDVLENKSIRSTDHIICDEFNKKLFNALINQLKDKQKRVLIMLYGLDGKEPLTLDQVSEIIGLTREGVRQIKNKSIKYLRNRAVDFGLNIEMFEA
jgi:RNA polymerase primary sigma factor